MNKLLRHLQLLKQVVYPVVITHTRIFRSYTPKQTLVLNLVLFLHTTGQHAQQPVCTFKTFMDCRPSTFSGIEGAVGLLHWFEKLESVFELCECPEARRVKYATGTLEGITLTWWNAQVQMLGLAAANATPWNDFEELIKREYCT